MSMRLGNNSKIGIFVILACLLFSGFFLYAEKGPEIKFKEEKKDFGRVNQGKVLTHVFVFENTGDSPLTIKNVRTTCGCTAALVSERKLAPGKKGEIKVTFNTKGYGGDLSKYIYVESNDPKNPQKQLTVSVSIDIPPRPKIDLDRYSMDLGLILESEEILAKTKIKNKGERELQVTLSHKDASFFQGGRKISSLRIAVGKEQEVEIKIPARNGNKLLREYVLMKSNDPMRPNLSLYMSGYVVTKKQLKELFAKYKDILDLK